MRPAQQCAFHTPGGFTLVEAIGVLSIISIFAAMLIPPIFDEINRANLVKESQTLSSIADALKSSTIRTRTLPGDEWPRVAADELAAPLHSVTNSVAGHRRSLVFHPDMNFGTSSPALPYRQSSSGCPGGAQNAQAVLISSQNQIPLPAKFREGSAVSTAEFHRLWNTNDGQIPQDWPSEWQTKGSTLRIERINLAPLFCRVVAHSVTSSVPAQISIDQDPPFALPTNGLDTYYLHGTEVSLYEDGQLVARELLHGDRSYVFEFGRWRDQLAEGRPGQTSGFADVLSRFLYARSPVSSSAVTPSSISAAYSRFALTYSSWASSGFVGGETIPLPQVLFTFHTDLCTQISNIVR